MSFFKNLEGLGDVFASGLDSLAEKSPTGTRRYSSSSTAAPAVASLDSLPPPRTQRRSTLPPRSITPPPDASPPPALSPGWDDWGPGGGEGNSPTLACNLSAAATPTGTSSASVAGSSTAVASAVATEDGASISALSAKEEECRQLRVKFAKLLESTKKLRKLLLDKESEIKEVRLLGHESADLKKALSCAAEKEVRLLEELMVLRPTVDEIKDLRGELSILRAENTTLKEKEREWTAKNSNLEANQDLRRQLDSSELQRKELEEALAAAGGNLISQSVPKDLANDCDRLRVELSEAHGLIKVLQATSASTAAAVVAESSSAGAPEVEDLKQEVESLNMQRKHLEEELVAARAASAPLPSAWMPAPPIVEDLKNTRQECEGLKLQLAEANGLIDALKLSLENSATSSMQESDTAAARMEKLRELAEQVSPLRGELEAAKQQAAAKKAELDESQSLSRAAADKMEALAAELRGVKEELKTHSNREAELESRALRLSKEKDKLKQELDLQSARRKEAIEMARSLESQIAGADRAGQDREEELKAACSRIDALQRTLSGAAAEAKRVEQLTTTIESLTGDLERERKSQREAEAARLDIAREMSELQEKLELEEAEKVTLVASLTQERDFLLKQVGMLESKCSEAESRVAIASEEQQKAEALDIAIDKYRARAQEALKRANAVTSELSSKNQALEAELQHLQTESASLRAEALSERERAEAEMIAAAEAKQMCGHAQKKLSTAMEELQGLAEERSSLQESAAQSSATNARLESQVKSLKAELLRQSKLIEEAEIQIAESHNRAVEAEKREQANADAVKVKGGPGGVHVATSSPTYPDHSKQASAVVGPGSPVSPKLSLAAAVEDALSGCSVISSAPTSPRASDDNEVKYVDDDDILLHLEGPASDLGLRDPADAQQLFFVSQLLDARKKDQLAAQELVRELTLTKKALQEVTSREAGLAEKLEAQKAMQARSEVLDPSVNPDAAHYLKNVCLRYMQSDSPSERVTLAPVVATILQFSTAERAAVTERLEREARAAKPLKSLFLGGR
jgi:chromosome segregation ATPase